MNAPLLLVTGTGTEIGKTVVACGLVAAWSRTGLRVAGLKPVHIVVLLLLGATLVGAAVVTGKVEAYQLDRLTGFTNQSTQGTSAQDLHPAEYNLKASKTAVSSAAMV